MPETTPPLPEPTEGGSYSRDPVTGALTRVSPEQEQAPAQHQKPEGLRAVPAPEPAPQPAAEE